MDFAKLLKARRSVRAFQTKAVPEETLASILEAANSAPSAGNLQAYDILVVASLTDGTAASFQLKGAIRNTGGTVAFIGTPPAVVSLGADAGTSTWTASAVANDANDSLDIVVRGSGSGWVSWVANVRTVELTPSY